MLPATDSQPLRTRNRSIFVTGGGGFIGSALVARLAARDVPLHVLLGGPDDSVIEPPPNVSSSRAYITDAEKLAEMAAGSDVVVHLAGPASVGASFSQPALYAEVHVAGTATMLEVCRRTKIGRIVYISSAEVYGRAAVQPVTEEQPPEPRSPYAAAKVAAEAMVRAYVNAFEMHACILRPFSVYGPRQPQYALVPTILRKARTEDAIVLADLAPVRDYCYVADLIDAIVLACDADLPGLSVFNIGTGVPTSVLELARTALRIVDRDIPIQSGALVTRPKEAEIYELVADVRRAEAVLHWKPSTPLADGLSTTAEAQT